MRVLSLFLLSAIAGTVAAEVALDGTMGPSGAVVGPEYTIAETMGSRHGGNLFHSFATFNVRQNEAAIFQGSPGLENIFARVTGGGMSMIDGRIATDPSAGNAALWLINPAGWLFGPHARVDVAGAFHVSTAAAVNFQDGSRFFADPAGRSQLTIAAPLETAFLQPSQAAITFDGADISRNTDAATTLTAGDIVLRNQAKLTANTESTRNAGTIQLTAQNQIALLEGSRIEARALRGSGHAGQVTLEARNVLINQGSAVSSSSSSSSTGQAGSIRVTAQENLLLDGVNTGLFARIQGTPADNRSPPNIAVSARQLSLSNEAAIRVETITTARAGDIHIQAERIALQSGGTIDSTTQPGGENFKEVVGGDGGTITIAAKHLTLRDEDSLITSSSFGRGGKGGNIVIDADRIEVAESAEIRALSKSASPAGNITLHTHDLIIKQTHFFESDEDPGPDIASLRTNAEQADGGQIKVRALSGIALHNGLITTSVDGGLATSGDGGNISLDAPTLILNTGFIQGNTTTKGGRGGDIVINTPNIIASQDHVWVGGNERRAYQFGSGDNVIQAAAPDGISGDISIAGVQLNITGQLLDLESRFARIDQLGKDPCQVARGQAISSLVVMGQGGLPYSLDDPLSLPLSDAPQSSSTAPLLMPEFSTPTCR